MSLRSLVSRALTGSVRDSDVEDSARRRRNLVLRQQEERDRLIRKRRAAKQRRLRQGRLSTGSYKERAAVMTADIKIADVLGIKLGKRRRH